jgi:hypothetical protein
MFQLFMGKPSISEGLSLNEFISTHDFAFISRADSFDVHISLLRDELHGPLDL